MAAYFLHRTAFLWAWINYSKMFSLKNFLPQSCDALIQICCFSMHTKIKSASFLIITDFLFLVWSSTMPQMLRIFHKNLWKHNAGASSFLEWGYKNGIRRILGQSTTKYEIPHICSYVIAPIDIVDVILNIIKSAVHSQNM